MAKSRAKVTVLGVGTVGAAVAFVLAAGGLATELVLIDPDRPRAEAQARDLSDAAAFIKPVKIQAGDYPDSIGSAAVVFCAGVAEPATASGMAPAGGAAPAGDRPGSSGDGSGAPGSGLELARANLDILRQALPRLLRFCPEAVYVMVTRPVDIMTYAANRLADMGDERIIGVGTVLATSRLKSLVAGHVEVDPRNVHAYVVGEHGGSETVLWSRVSVAGFHIDDYCRRLGLPLPDREAFFGRAVREPAAKPRGRYAVSLAVARIVEAVLRNERSVLTVSAMQEGVYGLEGPNCFSLPALVDGSGKGLTLPLTLDPGELDALSRSAAGLKNSHRTLGLT